MNNNGSKWVLWLVTGAAAVALLFICGVGGLILRSEYRDEIGVLLGGESVPTLAVPSLQETDEEGENAPPATETAGIDQVRLQETAAALQATNSAPTEAAATDEAATETPALAPTVTQKPLATAPPVPTATIPPSGSVTAFRTAQPILIDGDLAGWGDVPSYPAIYTVYTISDWNGSDDLQGYWRLAWDDSNLYVGAVVIDDVHVQNASYGEIFRGDGLEIQFDSDLQGDYGSGLSPDDFQVALSPGDFQARQPEAWRWQATAAGTMANAPGHGVRVAASQTEQGYVLEAAIPWSDIAVRPTPGLIIGVALNVNDNDTIGSKRQEMMKSHIASRVFADPSSWGQLILGE